MTKARKKPHFFPMMDQILHNNHQGEQARFYSNLGHFIFVHTHAFYVCMHTYNINIYVMLYMYISMNTFTSCKCIDEKKTIPNP